MSQQISVAPPVISEVSPDMLALAKYLRNNKIEKQRPAIYNGNRIDMFRAKRFVRALLSEDYRRASKKNKNLPHINTEEDARKILARFPVERLAFNVEKLDTNDAIFRQMKPQNGVPVVIIAPNQKTTDDEYFVWFFNHIPITAYLRSLGIIVVVACMALFQLWPIWARRIAYYVSIGCIVLLGALMGLAVARFIIFGVTYFVLSKALWIFPNLFADVGVLQSFRPFYSLGSDPTLPVPERRKKRVSKPLSYYEEKAQKEGNATGPANSLKAKGNAPGGPGGPGGPIPMPPPQFPFTKEMMIPMPPGQGPTPPPGQMVGMLHPEIAEVAKRCMEGADKALQDILKKSNKQAIALQELQKLRQQLALKKWEDSSKDIEAILAKIRRS